MNQSYLKVKAICLYNPNCYFDTKETLFSALEVTNTSEYPIIFKNNLDHSIYFNLLSIDRSREELNGPLPHNKSGEEIIPPKTTVVWAQPVELEGFLLDGEAGKGEAIVELILRGVMHVNGKKIEFEERSEFHAKENTEFKLQLPKQNSQSQIAPNHLKALPNQVVPVGGEWFTTSLIDQRKIKLNSGDSFPSQEYDKSGNAVIWYLKLPVHKENSPAPDTVASANTKTTCRVGEICPTSGIWEASLPKTSYNAPALATAPQRFQKIKAGSPMPEVYAKSLARETADADNAAITWTLVRAD